MNAAGQAPSIPRRILCVSIPRSGHHYLVSILRHALDADCHYCEYYTPVECCRRVPCTWGEAARVAIQKNHDFELDVPTDLPEVTYAVQYRNPVMAVLSDREYMARLEGQARADDKDEFRVWLGKKGAHYRRFWDKWLSRRDARLVVIEYAELMQHPLLAARRVLDAAGIGVEAGRLEAAVDAVSATVADFPLISPSMPFVPRVLSDSRYFDRDLMSVYESMLLETVVGLEPTGLLPHVESAGHPVRLVYEAALCTANGRPGDAAELLRRAAEADPENPYVREELSHACRQAGALEDAIAAAQEAIRLSPKNPVMLRLLSDLHSARSSADLDRAIELARATLDVNPLDPGQMVHLAALLSRRREHGQAAALAAQAMAGSPADPNVWRECSEVLSMAGEVQGALDAVSQALIRVPGHAEYHHHQGNLLARAGHLDDAIRAHAHALAIAPHETFWRGALARELASAGRLEEALQLIETGLNLQPGHDHLRWVRQQLQQTLPVAGEPASPECER